MTRILILYGTTDGQTARIARFLGDELRWRGAEVEVWDAAAANPEPADFTGILVAASIHAGGYQRSVMRWVRAHIQALRAKRTTFLSVCLGILQDDPRVLAELQAIRDRFIARTGWTPTQFKMVAGALRYTRYGWLKKLVLRRIAGKAGGSTDTSRDHEYTDWGDLRAFADSFYALCAAEEKPLWDAAHRRAGPAEVSSCRL